MRESIEVMYVESGSSDGEPTARLLDSETGRLGVEGDILSVEGDSLSVEGATHHVEVVQRAAANLDRLEEKEFDWVVCADEIPFGPDRRSTWFDRVAGTDLG